jgi:hypothetical protein
MWRNSQRKKTKLKAVLRKTTVKENLLYKCEVAKLGTAATGNFLSGKREKEGERERENKKETKKERDKENEKERESWTRARHG